MIKRWLTISLNLLLWFSSIWVENQTLMSIVVLTILICALIRQDEFGKFYQIWSNESGDERNENANIFVAGFRRIRLLSTHPGGIAPFTVLSSALLLGLCNVKFGSWSTFSIISLASILLMLAIQAFYIEKGKR